MSRAMQNKEGLSIGQAARALGISSKTVRRQLKQGKMPFKLVPGKFGQEYRILELPPDKMKSDALDATPALALDIIHRLEQENRNLAGQLGASQERCRSLENQVRLLAAARHPWWYRIFKRR